MSPVPGKHEYVLSVLSEIQVFFFTNNFRIYIITSVLNIE